MAATSTGFHATLHPIGLTFLFQSFSFPFLSFPIPSKALNQDQTHSHSTLLDLLKSVSSVTSLYGALLLIWIQKRGTSQVIGFEKVQRGACSLRFVKQAIRVPMESHDVSVEGRV